MKSIPTASFRKLFARLPLVVQQKALETLDKWIANPQHPGLEFKKLKGNPDLVSIRIGIQWRAVGYQEEDTVYWKWIGHHSDYDAYLKRR